MSLSAIFTLAVLVATVALMAREFLSPDYLLLGALMVLAASGILSPEQALSGFSNPALATIGGLFLVAAGVRATGMIDRVTAFMFGEESSLAQVLSRLTTLTGVASAFLSNTAIVALGIPALDRWARDRGISPSKLLIPLSYASILGGLCTLIGTSTNVVMDGLMRANGIDGLGFFELAVVGVPLLAVGILYLTFVAPRILPDRRDTESAAREAREFVAEVKVTEGSPLAGRTAEETGLLEVSGLFLVRLERETGVVAPVGPGERLAAGDRLTFAGELQHIVDVFRYPGVTSVSPREPPEGEPAWELYRVVITPGSPLVGQAVQEAEFRARYNAAVVAVQRRGEEMPSRIPDTVLRPGDVVLVEAGPEFGRAHRESSEFFVVSPIEGTIPRRSERQWVAGLLLVGMIGAAATGLLPLPIAAPTAGLLMVLTGCADPGEARRSVNWSVLVTVGSAISVAKALEVSGAAGVLGHGISALATLGGGWAVLLAIFFTTVLLTELIINQAAAALMFPVVIAVAASQGLDPRPLVLAATVGASMSFSTPLNYQTNLMVYGPGKYRFTDFTRTGLPLQLLLSVVAVATIQLVWPLQAA